VFLINVMIDKPPGFDVLLTRVPCIGEEIIQEDRSYRITRVQHVECDRDGKARWGCHAFLEAELVPPEEE